MAVLGRLSLGNVHPSRAPYCAVFPVPLSKTLVTPRLKLSLLEMLELVGMLLVVSMDLQDQVPVLAANSALGDKTATMESVPAVVVGKVVITTTTTTMEEGGNEV